MTTDGSSIGRLAVRNTVWVTLLSYAAQLIAFATIIVLTRTLGPQVFGLFSLGLFWSSLLGVRTKFGLASAAVRQPSTDGELLGTYYLLDLALAGVSLLIATAAAALLVQVGYPMEVGLVVIVATLAEAIHVLVGPLALAMERELQLSRLTLVSLVSTSTASGVAIMLALTGAGIGSLLAMNLVTAAVTVVGVYVVCRWRLPGVFRMGWRFNPGVARRLVRQGLPYGLSALGISTIVNQYDNFLIGTLVGTTTLGFYDRAYRTSQWPNIILTTAMVRVGFVAFTRLQNDLPRLTHAVRLSIWVLTTLGTPLVLALIFGAEDLVQVLYGPSWLPSTAFLRFLVAYSMISPFISVGSSLAYARGNMRMSVVITAAQVISIILLATPLTLWYGAMGTVAGVGLTIAVGFGLSCRYILRTLSLSAVDLFGPALAAAALASVVSLVVTNVPGWEGLTPLIRFAGSTSVSAGSYLVALFLIRPREMVDRARYLFARFRGPESQAA